MQQFKFSPIQLLSRIDVSDRTLLMFLDPNVSATPGAAATHSPYKLFLDASRDDMIGIRSPSRMQEQKIDIPKATTFTFSTKS